MLIEFPRSTDNRLLYIIPYFDIWKNKDNNRSLPFITKMCRFKRNIIENKFINNEIKNLSFKYLDDIIRTLYLKYKYSKLWMFRILCKRPSMNSLDLEFNEINNTISDIIVYIDNEERRKYLFSQKDFNKLVKTSLEHSYAYDAIPEPLPIRNPYTNKEILKHDLISIDRMLKNPPLVWHMFKSCRYDINNFKTIHNGYLLNMCISSFIDGLENDDIIFYLHDMFEFFKIENYCNKCIDEFRDIRTKMVRNTLIKWMAALKLEMPFMKEDMYYLIKLYIIPCIIHSPKRKIGTRFKPEINTQFTGGPLDPNKLYIFKAVLNDNVRPKKIKKVKYINIDPSERYRKKLKKRFGIKSIE
jgi:hypothetical protein